MIYSEQIKITLLDKGLLALIIVIATFCVNIILERYKSYKSRNNEILKIRIVAMNNIWTKIYAWIEESNSLLMSYNVQIEDAKKQINDTSADVVKVVEANRFLSGNGFANDCLTHVNEWAMFFVNPHNIKWDDGHYRGLRAQGESIISSLPKYLDALDKK